MTELDFYKWAIESKSEYRWQKNNNEEDVLIWVSQYEFDDFCNLVKSGDFSEGGITCAFLGDCVAIWASELLEPYGIPIENIFPKP